MSELFKRRWPRKNKVLYAINALADVKLTDFDDYLFFLDFMSGTDKSGRLPENVIVANVLRALPADIAEKILYLDSEVTLEELYSF